MARISEKSQVAIPAAVVGAVLAAVSWRVVQIDRENVKRDGEREAQAAAIEKIEPKLDAVLGALPRIETKVEWIQATMQRTGATPFSVAPETAGTPSRPSVTP